MSFTTYRLSQFFFVGLREIEPGGNGELLSSPSLFVTRIGERLAPFEMQTAPMGRVFVRFFEFGECQIRVVLLHQRFAPHLERIGKMRAFRMRLRKLCDGSVILSITQQHRAPIGSGERHRRRLGDGACVPKGCRASLSFQSIDLSSRADTIVTIARRAIDRAARADKIAEMDFGQRGQRRILR